MKKNLFIVTAGILCLVLFAAGCTTPQQGGTSTPSVTPAPGSLPGCGFTSCHGLDLACGTNPPEACTMQYQIGDKCRQYAFCSNAGGTCSLVTSAAYDTCRSCVERCGGADSSEIFLCEEKC